VSLRISSFALAALALVLAPALGPAAPPPGTSGPQYVNPPSYYRPPLPTPGASGPQYVNPPSYYQPPPPPIHTFVPIQPGWYPGSPYYPTPKPMPPATSGLDVPLIPPGLRQAEEREAPAGIEVRVPAGAQLWFGGDKTRQTGEVRVFQSPPLEPGKPYTYEVEARWTQGGKEVVQTRKVPVKAGTWTTVDFTR
jgi:uncharacterized protein (TIGR03000 family)